MLMFAQKMIPLTDEEEPEDYCDESESDAPCMRYNCTYFSVTPKLSNKSVYYTFLSPFIHTVRFIPYFLPRTSSVWSLLSAAVYPNRYNVDIFKNEPTSY